MELTASDAVSMIGLAFDRMLANARRLGDRVAERPDVAGANSVSALIVHCIGVTEHWLEREVLGRPVARDRDAEFVAELGVAELEARVAALCERLPAVLAEVAAAPAPAAPLPDGFEAAWPWTPAGMVLHVLEELFQHAGHADIGTDVLLAR